VSFRLWKRPKSRPPAVPGPGSQADEVDSIELIRSPTSPAPTCVTPGNRTRETLRCGRRAVATAADRRRHLGCTGCVFHPV